MNTNSDPPTWTLPTEFSKAALELSRKIESHGIHFEAENNFILGKIEQALTTDTRIPLFLAQHPNWFAFYNGHFLILGRITNHDRSIEDVSQLVGLLKQQGINPKGVLGAPQPVAAFVNAWDKNSPSSNSQLLAQRIHILQEIIPITKPSGRALAPTMSDINAIAQLVFEFDCEASALLNRSAADSLETTQRWIEEGHILGWQNDGEWVAIAALVRFTRNGAAIGAVYTPPRHRGKGFGAAISAEVSSLGLNHGKIFCTLYTDNQNPISNHIYSKIGYRPICDAHHCVF